MTDTTDVTPKKAKAKVKKVVEERVPKKITPLEKLSRPKFLPSLSKMYASLLDVDNCRQSLAKFDFYNNPDAYFRHTDLLFSAAYANVKEGQAEHKMFANRNREETFLLGDSGGFQILTGKLKFNWEDINDPANDKLRMNILRWCERECDYAMTLDVPAKAKEINNAVFKNMDIILEHTIHNLEFYKKHMDPNSTCKFLNVLSGYNTNSCEMWYQAVKDYDFTTGGYSFAGVLARNIYWIVHYVIRIIKDKGDIGEVIHFLGNAKIEWAPLYSSLQTAINKHHNPNTIVTYDASSAFQTAITNSIYQGPTFSAKGVTMTPVGFFKGEELIGVKAPIPYDGPVFEHYGMDDMFIDCGNKSNMDRFSYAILMANNIAMQAKNLNKMVDIFELELASKRPGLVSADIHEIHHVIDRAIRDLDLDYLETKSQLLFGTNVWDSDDDDAWNRITEAQDIHLDLSSNNKPKVDKKILAERAIVDGEHFDGLFG